MKQILIAVLDSDLSATTEDMGRYGAVHLLPVEEWGDWVTQELAWREVEDLSSTYGALLRRIQTLLQELDVIVDLASEERIHIAPHKTAERMDQRLVKIEERIRQITERQQELRKETEQLVVVGEQLKLLTSLSVDLADLRTLDFLYFVPAFLAEEALDRFRESLVTIPNAILPLLYRDGKVLIFAFCAREHGEVLERALKSAYAERQDIPDELVGTPQEALRRIQARQIELVQESERLRSAKGDFAAKHRTELSRVYRQLTLNYAAVDAWRHFGTTRRARLIFGWLPARAEEDLVSRLSKAVEGRFILYSEEPPPLSATSNTVRSQAPTALKNPAVIKPFESIVTTYGIPNYREIDPTPISSLFIMLMFGIMFGDVGQGAVIAALGFLLAMGIWFKQRYPLGWVLFGCGLSAMVSGFLYGSVFLLDDLIPPLWARPIDNPQLFILLAIALGIVVISVGLILNAADAVLTRDYSQLLLGRYGLVGLWFYWGSVLIVVGYFVTRTVSLSSAVTLLGIPLVLLFFREPLSRLLRSEEVGCLWAQPLALFQSGIEVFDAAVRYLGNTLSFGRLAAFGISHSGISVMVLTLAALVRQIPLAEPVVLIIGNALVIALEGLVVSIQVIRLNYYEFFTKFFRADGIAYQPFILPSASTAPEARGEER